MLTNQSIDPQRQKPPFILWRPFLAFWHWLVPPTQAHRDRQSKSSRLFSVVFILVLCGGATASALYYAHPIYNAYQDWRASKAVVKARSLADQGEIYAAVMEAQSAYSLSPENRDAVRLNAEFFTLLKRNEALYFWEKLRAQAPLNPAEEQLYVRALLNADREKEAQQEMQQAASNLPIDDAILGLAQNVFNQGDFSATILPRLKDYAARHPDDRLNLLRLAKIQIESGLTDEVPQGLASLWKLSEGDDSTSLKALEQLNDFSQLPPEDMHRLIKRLQNHPRSTPSHGIQALNRQLQLNPDHRTEIVVAAIDRYQHTHREDLLPLIRWLVDLREFQQVLAILDEAQALTYQPLLENYLTALTALKRFDDLQRLVEDPRTANLLTQATRAFYRLHLAFVMRKPLKDLRGLMETATRHAEQEGRAELLLAIGKYGEERSMADLAEPAYQSALRSRRTFVPALEGLLRTTLASGNTPGHLAALREALRQSPDNQDYQEKLLYACLLTGLQIETCAMQAQTLIDNRPSDPETKLLIAMGWWRLRNEPKAAQALHNLDFTGLNDGQRAVFASIALACGLADEARKVAGSIQADASMFPEERAFFLSAQQSPP
jgi:tetratricopeptide (TPR) repeat protein